ncbi:MAG TPA: aminoacyl-tRNA hydrolase [Chloroflexota bacterium]
MTKLIVGLGNPGTAYQRTRHNVGFEVVWELERRSTSTGREQREGPSVVKTAVLGGTEVILARPRTFMNESGRAVSSLVHRHQVRDLNDLLVIHDDMDLPLANLRLRAGGSNGGHNGVGSIIGALGTQRFARLRIGIDRPPAGMDPIEYVLGAFSSLEREALALVLETAAEAAEYWVEHGIAQAMNRFNSWRPSPEAAP